MFEDDQYLVGERDLLVTVSYTWFGIAHMALGVLMIIASYGLFWGRTWGACAIVASVGAITNLASLSADLRPVRADDRARHSRDLCRGSTAARKPGVLTPHLPGLARVVGR